MTHERQLELVFDVKNNSQKSFKLLLGEYKPLIKSQSRNFKSIYAFTPIEMDDIENMMSFFFYELVCEYDEARGKNFPSYIKEFLFYRTSTWMKKFASVNNRVMNYYQVDDEETLLNNEDSQLDREYVIDILEASENFEILTKIEREVLKLNYSGKTIKEISKLLNKNEKTLYAARNRAINKIRKENTL